jgi:hypothetical protein
MYGSFQLKMAHLVVSHAVKSADLVMSHMTQNGEGDAAGQQAGPRVHETSDDSIPTQGNTESDGNITTR